MPRGAATASQIEVRVVESKADWRAFIELPYTLHSHEPAFVPPLQLDVKARLNRRKNPFFLHSEAEFFLAWRHGNVVGRIAAIENRRHNDAHAEKIGFFGWFECGPDEEAGHALLDQAASWVEKRGLNALRGPASYSLNDEAGLLVQGFERSPTLLTAWNPPYYVDLLESWGLEKKMDLISFSLPGHGIRRRAYRPHRQAH